MGEEREQSSSYQQTIQSLQDRVHGLEGLSEDSVTPFHDRILALEGDRVTLSCNYSVSIRSLYWYRQYSSSSPQLLITDYSEKLAAMCFECRAQKDNVLQPKGDVTVSEGETVTLDCHYNTSGSNTYLYWYRQAADDKPTFILSRFSVGSGNTADGFKERFDSSLDSSSRSVPLKIQSLQLSDSAVYYCALRPTVTGNCKTYYKNLWSVYQESRDKTMLNHIH
ncbi:uncharacterized protein LOC130133148 [Lampris incognitus]|uniref:uncharacterized protein LOC130133148 n=1 Tax=Lampris incognitus TaxID=2546036 RepID=UPI0024B5151C|nr:uncharacterized protein LOC130133148 [Lampris incognitus]